MSKILLFIAAEVASVVSCPGLQQTEKREEATVIIQENLLPGEDVEQNGGIVELSGKYILELKEEKRKVCPYEVQDSTSNP